MKDEKKELLKEQCEQDNREDVIIEQERQYKPYIGPYDFEPISDYFKDYYLQDSIERLCRGCSQRPVDRLICLQRHCDAQDRLIGRLDGLIP